MLPPSKICRKVIIRGVQLQADESAIIIKADIMRRKQVSRGPLSSQPPSSPCHAGLTVFCPSECQHN